MAGIYVSHDDLVVREAWYSLGRDRPLLSYRALQIFEYNCTQNGPARGGTRGGKDQVKFTVILRYWPKIVCTNGSALACGTLSCTLFILGCGLN